MDLLLLAQESAAATHGVSGMLSGLDDGQRFVVVLTAIGCGTGLLIALGSIIVSAITTVQRRTTEAQLKREMLDRGMSAEEIARIIEASAPAMVDE